MTTGNGPAVPPNEVCYSVDDFMDGELSEKDAENFRHHLAGCCFCAKQLGHGWLLDERMYQLGAHATQGSGGKWLRILIIPTGILFAVAVAAVTGALVWRGAPEFPLASRSSKAR